MLAISLEKWKLTTCFARKYVALRANEAIAQIRGTLVAVDFWMIKNYTFHICPLEYSYQALLTPPLSEQKKS